MNEGDKPMLRFAMFAGENPCGGWEDYQGAYATREEAVCAGVAYVEDPNRWYHVVDLSIGQIVAEGFS